MKRVSATQRPTKWWLEILHRRRAKMYDEKLTVSQGIEWSSPEEQRAAIKFFNAAFRAEESGITQAHELAGSVAEWDPDLADVLRLYGDEEGWHRELLTEFLAAIGGTVQPMGRVTRTFYSLYARAKRMETIVLTNLMFETIGATTYRLALRNVQHVAARQMLTILTRDESFHVPLNVHFLRHVLNRASTAERRRLQVLFQILFVSLTLLPLASRPKAKAFDRLSVADLSRAYADQMARLFAREPDLELNPPRWLLRLLNIDLDALTQGEDVSQSSILAAERAADRENVQVSAL